MNAFDSVWSCFRAAYVCAHAWFVRGRPVGRVLVVLAVTFLIEPGATRLWAQESTAAGTIVGRVQDAVTGKSLNNARVSVKGTNHVTLTDEGGNFRLSRVAAGDVVLRVFFTGLDEQEIAVQVVPGDEVTQNVKLTSRVRYGDDETVVMGEFVVEAARETNAAAIAVNEQRMAAGQKSVISADEFGTIPDTNPGELMKWLPGVSVEYFANNIVGVSVRGLDAANTEIRFDGMPVASASTTGRDRNFEMLGASSADIARVEIRKLRTPEDSANALGGSINLIRRSAFEADKRRLTYNLLFTSDAEDFSFSRRDGIRDTQIQGWRPNWKLTWTDPVSKNFGYAVTLSHSDVLARVHWSAPSKNFGSEAQATAARARLDAGQPLTTVSVYNPLVTQELLHDNPKQDITDSGSIKFDWRPLPNLTVSYTVAASRYEERTGDELRFVWGAGNQNTTNLDTPLGAPGTNGESAVYGALGAGAIRYDMREAWRNGTKEVLTNTIETEWRKEDWTVSASGSYSTADHEYKDTEDGFFQSTTFVGLPAGALPNIGVGAGTSNPQPITVNLLDRDFKFAHTIDAYAHTAGATTLGPALDWQDLSNMDIGGAVSRPSKSSESIAALRLWAKRDFRFGANPFAVRVGFDYDEQYRNVQQYDADIWRFIGADGVVSTATVRSVDDSLAQIAAVNVQPARDTYYNSPAVPRISLRRLHDLYVANPSWFRYDDANSHRFSTISPFELSEKTSAGWLEFSGSLLESRLTYVGGLRYEKAEAWGLGNLDRGTRYVTDQGLVAGSYAGNLVQYVRKGARGEGGNDGMFPSLQVNYSFTNDLIARVGYAQTQAKNRFGRSVIPSSTFNFNPVTSGAYSGIAIGSVNRPNPNLEPWTADNFEASIEYYTPQGGVISLGGFLKEIQDVQVQQTILLDTPEALAELDLDSAFQNFQSTTWINQGDGRISGLEFAARQTLDPWLPDFAKGFTVTGSYNYNHLSKFVYLTSPTGNPSTDFQNFYETQIKTSVSYRRDRFSATVGVIRNGKVYRQRENVGAIRGDRYYPPYTTVDFSVEYAVKPWAKLFFSGRNITDAQKMRWRVLEGAPDWSAFQIANNLGVTYTAGISGSF